MARARTEPNPASHKIRQERPKKTIKGDGPPSPGRAAALAKNALPKSNTLSAGACYRLLRQAGQNFKQVSKKQARGVKMPIRLSGPLGGIEVRGGEASAPTNILDCRLALALLAWSPVLNRAGVTRIDHYSMYRKGARIAGTNRVSSHAYGLAIDAAHFHFKDGTSATVLDDWKDRRRGADPCTFRPREPKSSRIMRQTVCRAADQNLFQVVLTPHYDAAHKNHLHLEFKPGDKEPWVR